MPQMKPMNWILLFTLMNMILMMMNMNNFFYKNYSIKKNKWILKLYKNNWKW